MIKIKIRNILNTHNNFIKIYLLLFNDKNYKKNYILLIIKKK